MYITHKKRIPFGSFLGSYKNISALQLASFLVEKICEESSFLPSQMAVGCVLQAGVGQAFAKNILISSNEPMHIPGLTINKVCGSGMMSVIYGLKSLHFDEDMVGFLAGGVESMSQAPHFSNIRAGLKIGDTKLNDHIMVDGLLDYGSKKTMGELAETLALKYQISREEQEAYVAQSFENYSNNKEILKKDIVPFELNGEVLLADDEVPLKVDVAKFSKLRPAFLKDGTITAATSSALSDGASFLMLSRQKHTDQCAKIIGISEYSGHPKSFAEAPIFAVTKLLRKLDRSIEDIKVFEINEAFAVVPIAFQKSFGIDYKIINPYGGASIIGHPLGASGNRILLSLIRRLQEIGGGIGIASACIGGGEAVAIAIEV
jgi:acetyl-CoA C-acetyltransferase